MNINKRLNDFDKGWIIGLVEENASFTVNKIKIARKTNFGIKIYQYENPAFFLLARDRVPLEIAKQLLGMGKVVKHGGIFHLVIRKKVDCLRLVEFLDGKLRSEMKRSQFEKWKEKVLQWKERGRKVSVSSASSPPNSIVLG
ncbi:MAG: hypothetical protein QXH08_05090 [Candidatus Hadarchaeales archaeon]